MEHSHTHLCPGGQIWATSWSLFLTQRGDQVTTGAWGLENGWQCAYMNGLFLLTRGGFSFFFSFRVWTEKEEYLSLLGLWMKAGFCHNCWRTWRSECSRCKAANRTPSLESLAQTSLTWRSRCWSLCAGCTKRHLRLVWTLLWCFGSVWRKPQWWWGHQKLDNYTQKYS